MKIIYKNIEVEANEAASVVEFFKEKIEEDKNIIACIINNEVKPLNYILKENDEVELLDTSSRDGARIYTRGLLYIMSMAFKELYPNSRLTVNYQLSSSMFCEIENEVVTKDMIENVRKKMQEIIDKNLPIEKVEMGKKEAKEFIEKEKTTVGKIQLENKQKEEVSFYFCNDYYNYY